MLFTERSISCCLASSPLWVCWIWSTAPMILSSKVRTITPFTWVSCFPASSLSSAESPSVPMMDSSFLTAARASSSSSEGGRLTSSSEISVRSIA
ncbi:hypothetical protein F7725_014785 [Dissostichus mawsoni]|uniref:Uncharacterized protein n=1 Tax=Dissostichus mawsoni TaxID=36200 RepID=A0A7J5YZY6_DISMA|nr:hypothetical protein F7725_014785 [Dissostichus mawsoni]